MRVGLLIYGSLDTRSGGYRYDRELVAFLRSQGDEVHLCSLPWRHYPRHLLQNVGGDWAQTLARTPLDVLIQDELAHPSLVGRNAWLKKQASFPIISLVHHLRSDEKHPALVQPLYRAIEARYLRSIDGFICNSDATRASVQRLAGVNKPTVVAHPGREATSPAITPTDILARAQEPGPLKLLFVGNIIPRKGLHVLLTALAHLPPTMAQLSIVGDNTADVRYRRHLRTLSQRLGLADRVRWAGAVPDAALQQAYATHHALVVPSQHEGFGIVYLEAMAYGVIAVGTEAGGAGEIIRPGENGLLIPPNDAETLAARLLWLHQHRQEMGEMGVAAQQSWRQHPTWPETGARIRAFLETVCGSVSSESVNSKSVSRL